MRRAGREALSWISAHPAEFVRLTALGLGLAWRGVSIPQRAALIIPLATFPLIYYVVAYMPRYRVPMDWLLYTLAGAAVWGLVTRAGRQWPSR